MALAPVEAPGIPTQDGSEAGRVEAEPKLEPGGYFDQVFRTGDDP